jgi:ribosomal protein L16 Arg81 hydroxylase
MESLLDGPFALDIHECDIYSQVDPPNHSLQVIAGMKDTWTRPHVDANGESSWFLLLEGYKVWILGRPEARQAFEDRFPDAGTWPWASRTTESHDFLQRTNSMMVLQRPGDILYIPYGWSHLVKNLCDTLTVGGFLLNGWHFFPGVSQINFSQISAELFSEYSVYYQYILHRPASVGLWQDDVTQIRNMWERNSKKD